MLDLLITGGEALTLDRDRRLIPNAAVAIKDGRIAAVGRADEFAGAVSAQTIDATGMAILPGLVDAHGHNGHGLTKGLAEHMTGRYWLDLMEQIYFHNTTADFWYAEAQLSALEHLKFGVTTFISMVGSMPRADEPTWANAVAQAYHDTGGRGIVAIGPARPPWPMKRSIWRDGQRVAGEFSLARTFEVAERVIREWHGKDDRLKVYASASGLVPSMGDNDRGAPVKPLDAVDFDQSAGLLRLSREYGVGIHTHSYGGQIKAAYHGGMREILSPKLSCAHCTGLLPEEIPILADLGVNVCHGPCTRAYVRARCPVPELIEAGVNVAIGSDGSAPDRTFDIFPQMRVAMTLQRVYYHDTTYMPIGKVIEMATIDAAKALGIDDEVGSLEVGKRADVILLNLQQPHLAPNVLLPARIAYCAAGQDVDTVIVGGSVIMQGRRLTNTDERKAIDMANRELMAMLERANITHLLETPAELYGRHRYAPA